MCRLTLNLKLYKDDELILENDLKYTKEGEIIEFELDKIMHQIDIKEETLERYNDEFHFYLNFKAQKCTYELKSHQALFDIIVDDSFFEQKENGLEMAYAIETDDQKCKILLQFEK